MILSYEYEGTARCTCTQCGEVYEIEFNGNHNNFDIDNNIKYSLEEEGWEDNVCPTCLEELDRQEEYDDSESTSYNKYHDDYN